MKRNKISVSFAIEVSNRIIRLVDRIRKTLFRICFIRCIVFILIKIINRGSSFDSIYFRCNINIVCRKFIFRTDCCIISKPDFNIFITFIKGCKFMQSFIKNIRRWIRSSFKAMTTNENLVIVAYALYSIFIGLKTRQKHKLTRHNFFISTKSHKSITLKFRNIEYKTCSLSKSILSLNRISINIIHIRGCIFNLNIDNRNRISLLRKICEHSHDITIDIIIILEVEELHITPFLINRVYFKMLRRKFNRRRGYS